MSLIIDWLQQKKEKVKLKMKSVEITQNKMHREKDSYL